MREKGQKKRRTDTERNILSTARGGSILFTGQLVEYALTLVFAVVVARFLGASDFGLYRLALAIVAVLGALSPLGLGGGLDRFVPIARKEGDEARLWGIIQVGVGIPVMIGIGVSIILTILAEPVANFIFDEPELAPLLRIISVGIPIHVLCKALASITVGFKQVQYEVYSMNLTFNVVKLALSIGAIGIGLGVGGVTAGYVIAELSAAVLLVIFVNKLFPLRRPLRTGQRNTREMFRYSFPLFLSQFLNQFGRRFETLILGVFSVAKDVGVYAAILSVSAVGNMGFVALRKVSSPFFAELYSQGKIKEMESLYQTTTKWSMAFNLPFFLIMVLLPDNVLAIYGKEFEAGSAGLTILAIGTLVDASTGACGNIINMTGHSRISFVNSFVYFGATLVLDLLLIPSYSLIGAAIAGAVTLIIINLLRIYQVHRLIQGMLPFNVTFWKPIAASIVAGAVTFAIRDFVLTEEPILQLAVLSTFMWLVYVGMIFAFKLDPEDRMVVRGVWNRFAPKQLRKRNDNERNQEPS